MKDEKRKNMPKNEEDYKVKYVFKEDSILDVNKVIKDCFLMELNKAKL